MPRIDSAQLIDLLLRPSVRRPLLTLVIVVSVLCTWLASRVTVSFELEALFAKGNEELTFFEEHVERFGYDNDYLTIVLQPSGTIYDSAFLQEARAIVQQVRVLEHVRFVFSPLDLPRMERGPLGMAAFPMFDEPSQYGSDSIFIVQDPLLRTLVDARYLSLLLHHDHLGNEEGAALFQSIGQVLENSSLEHRLIGRIPGESAFLELIREDFLLFLIASLAVCLLTLWLISRRWALTIMPMLVCGLTLLWTFGLMGLVGLPVTIMTSLLPPIILFVSSSDCIHLISSLRTSNGRRSAMQKVFFPTLLTSVTTAVGFFSLMVLPVGALQTLGLLAGFGTLVAFVLTYLLAPHFPSRYTPRQAIGGGAFARYYQWLRRHERAIMLCMVFIAGLGSYLSSQLRVDAYLLRDLPKSAVVRQDFEWANLAMGGSKPWEISLTVADTSLRWWDLKVQREVNKVTKWLEEDFGASNVLSTSKALAYANYLSSGQYTLPETVERRTMVEARRLTHQLRLPLVSGDLRHGRISAIIPEWGSHETQRRNDQLLSFINREINGDLLEWRLTGTTYMIDYSHGVLSRNIVKSLLLAVMMVSLVLALYFRSWKTALVALAPNLLPLVIIGGALELMDVPIQLSTSIIFALVFGIVVDDSIHFLASYRNAEGATPEARIIAAMNTAGRGMINTSLVLASGFAILIASNFGATYYLGLFLCLSLVIALVIDFTLLPILLRWAKLKR